MRQIATIAAVWVRVDNVFKVDRGVQFPIKSSRVIAMAGRGRDADSGTKHISTRH
jgi:hypothetical protein